MALSLLRLWEVSVLVQSGHTVHSDDPAENGTLWLRTAGISAVASPLPLCRVCQDRLQTSTPVGATRHNDCVYLRFRLAPTGQGVLPGTVCALCGGDGLGPPPPPRHPGRSRS